MTDSSAVDQLLEKIAQILIRCFFYGFAVLCFWFISLMAAGDLMYRIQAAMIPITLEQFHTINFCGMLFVKAFLFFGLLFPCIAIRQVLKKE